MRPGGRPKSPKSGVYWVNRARSRGGKKKEKQPIQEFNPMDLDHDGIVTPWEVKAVIITYVSSIVLGIIFLLFLFYLAYLGS